MKMRVFLFLASLLISFNLIYAGGVVKIKHSGADGTSKGTSTMYVQDGLLRMESKVDGENTIMIFDSVKEIMYHINVSETTYMAITKDDFKKVGKKMNDAMKQLEEQMKNLPAEQQEMMKKMMKGNLGDVPTEEVEKTEFEKVKSGIEVNGWTCDKYVGTLGGEKVEEIWVTDWNASGIGDEYKDAFGKLKGFFDELVQQMGPMAQQMSDGIDDWMVEDGIPIKTVSYDKGKVISNVMVEDVKEESLNSSLFKVPNGYTEENPFDKL